MNRKIIFFVILMTVLCAKCVFAQDYQATAESLQMQLQIMQLQATIDALQSGNNTGNTNNSSSGTSSTGNQQNMWNWGQQNSPYYATPTPLNSNPGYSGSVITSSNFPSYARPSIPVGPPPTWTKPKSRTTTEIMVGDAGQYETINEAVKHIPNDAGEVVIKLVSDTEEPQAGVSVPIGKKISSFRITSDTGARRTIWPKDRSVWFFCNGIPLIVDQSVTFADSTMIMGGLVTYAGHNVEVPESTIIINGKAYWVYAGGQSDRDGHSSTVKNALVIINGEVDRVYAGGRAIWGETIVHNATVVVNGTAKEVYCSGFAQNPSSKTTVGRADMRIYGWYNIYGLGLGSGDVTLQNPIGCIQ